jgi:chromosome segregation ATPase
MTTKQQQQQVEAAASTIESTASAIEAEVDKKLERGLTPLRERITALEVVTTEARARLAIQDERAHDLGARVGAQGEALAAAQAEARARLAELEQDTAARLAVEKKIAARLAEIEAKAEEARKHLRRAAWAAGGVAVAGGITGGVVAVRRHRAKKKAALLTE